MSKKIFYYAGPSVGRFPNFIDVTQLDNGDISLMIGSEGAAQSIALDALTLGRFVKELKRLGVISDGNENEDGISDRWFEVFKKLGHQ